MTTRFADMSGEELYEWYREQPQDTEDTFVRLRDAIRAEAMEDAAEIHLLNDEDTFDDDV